jgi:hypothetical protein
MIEASGFFYLYTQLRSEYLGEKEYTVDIFNCSVW